MARYTPGACRSARVDQRLNAALLSHDSATLALEDSCSHRLAPAVVAERVRGEDKPADAGVRTLLDVDADIPVAYRRVRLRCDARVLSEADNWYVPARLTAEMNHALDTSDIAFGRAVQALQFSRHTLSARLLWSPLPEGLDGGGVAIPAATSGRSLTIPPHVLEHRAVLTLPDGMPFCTVVESYTAALLDFPHWAQNGDKIVRWCRCVPSAFFCRHIGLRRYPGPRSMQLSMWCSDREKNHEHENGHRTFGFACFQFCPGIRRGAGAGADRRVRRARCQPGRGRRPRSLLRRRQSRSANTTRRPAAGEEMAGPEGRPDRASRQRDGDGRQNLRRAFQLSRVADDQFGGDFRRGDHAARRHAQLRHPVGFADLDRLARRPLVDDLRQLRPPARTRQDAVRPQGATR